MKDTAEIDIRQLFRALIKRWRLLVGLSVLLALIGYGCAVLTYVPRYTSAATFVVSNKSQSSGGLDQITSADLSAASVLANTFKYILLSDETMRETIEEYNLPYSIEALRRNVTVTPITGTNILKMSVTTTDAQWSYNIAQKIIDKYPAVLKRTLKTASLEVLDSPMIAAAPDGNNDKFNYTAVGFLIGAAASVLYAFIREYYNNKIKTSADITGVLGARVVVSIPQVDKKKKKGIKLEALLMTNRHVGFSFVENYKALRIKIENMARKDGLKSFVVTSTLENEGKTTVAVNLAIALSQNGKSVLLVDADLRKPSVLKILSLSALQDGLMLNDVLSGKIPVEHAIIKTDRYGFDILPCTPSSGNSTELLSSAKMKEIVEAACEKYDFVILDTAPSALVADSMIMTAYADAVMMVVRQDFAPAAEIAREMQNLSENNAKFIGCVFNIVDFSEEGYRGRYDRYGRKYGQYAAAYGEESRQNEMVR